MARWLQRCSALSPGFHPWASSAAWAVAGAERDLQPCPGASSLCIQLRGAHRHLWLLTLHSMGMYSPSWSCSAHGSLLHVWKPPWYKRNISDPHVSFLPPKDLGAGWTVFPTLICLGTCSGNSCSLGCVSIPGWRAGLSLCPGWTEPAAPCTLPSPPSPDSMVIHASSTKPLQLGNTPQV